MTLNQIIKITETVTGRKTPGNITSFLENEYYYSQSKGVNIKIGEMDLFYYINSTNKEFRELDVNKDALNKLREVKNILGPIA
jgi:hypothetical protein|tara:strand:+ start:811 stop:1059 length:249 start_codon:yes stop_codon:yes gene_type:complete